MSATQSRSGAAALKARSTRSSQTLTPGTRIVVRPWRLAIRPDRPAWRISRSTRLRATRSPSPMTSSAWILGDPYTPRFRAWISRIRSVRRSSSRARADGARLIQA
jgi:hypothetical protein